jgi:palmitoyltransferase
VGELASSSHAPPFGVCAISLIRVLSPRALSSIEPCILASQSELVLTSSFLRPLDEASQYRWPPKDPAKTIHHTAPPAVYEQSSGWYGEPAAPHLFPPGASSNSPFTYGDGFNPALRPSNQTYTQSEVESDVESNVESDVEPDVDDDHADQLRRRVAVRRGSEGYEVRPVAQWSI